jgi:hypothetical protein
MRQKILLISLLVSVSALVFLSGCIYDNMSGEVVLTEKICVSFEEYHDSPTLNSAVVSDKFKDRLLELLAEYGAGPEDIVSIGVVGGSYKVTKPSKTNDEWTISASVNIARQDDPYGPVTDGPALLMEETVQLLNDAQGKPVSVPHPAVLKDPGVQVINRALEDLLNGADPRLVVTLVGGTISPAPTPSNPLEFNWLACVTFQAVVDLDAYHSGQ